MSQLKEIIYADLIAGSSFNSKIPITTTSITFTISPIPEDKISEATLVSTGTEEIYMYSDDTNCYISPKNSGVIIRCNSNCNRMFYGLTNLLTIDFSNFDTTLLSIMDSMFQGCSSLVNIDLSSFKALNVSSMISTFQGCSSLVEIDINGIKTSNVVNMNNILHTCRSLKILDISNFDMTNTTTYNNMFYACSVLDTIGALYVNKDTLNKIVKMITSTIDKNIYISDSKISELEEIDKVNYIIYNESILSLEPSLTLNGFTDVCDELDLVSGNLVKHIGERPYSEGDETNLEVKTDMIKTLYKLSDPIISKVTLNGQKLYSYDGITYYLCSTSDNSPVPILTINVPTSIAQLIT